MVVDTSRLRKLVIELWRQKLQVHKHKPTDYELDLIERIRNELVTTHEDSGIRPISK